MSDILWAAVISGITGVLSGGAVGALIVAWANREKVAADANKSDAEAGSTISRAALELIEPYRDQVHSFRMELSSVRREFADLQRQNTELRVELRSAKQELGVLRRAERASTVEHTKQVAVVTTALQAHGISLPDMTATDPILRAERTRVDDHVPDRGDQ